MNRKTKEVSIKLDSPRKNKQEGNMGNGKRKETTTQRNRRLEKARQYAKRKYDEKRSDETLKNIGKKLKKVRTQTRKESVDNRRQKPQQIQQLNLQAKSMNVTFQRNHIEQLIQNGRSCKSQRLHQMRQNISQLLNKPDLKYTSPVESSTESNQYCLADLQRAMGASDREMAMLKQIGEIKDLSKLQDSEKSTIVPDELLADHSGKEVICPTCFCHFMGFPALQLHISKCHLTTANNGEALVKTQSKRSHLESTDGNRLICFMCQQILPGTLMSSHLIEHSSKPTDIAKCQPIGDPVLNDINDEGEKFKYKMFDALGDLLDRAADNLISAKQDSSTGMSDIAVQLLNNLCTLKKKSTPHQRLHPSSKEMLLKVFDKYYFEEEQKKGSSNGLKVGNFTCRICGESFLWESKASWRKHVLEVHGHPCEIPNIDDLPSDHDKAIGGEGKRFNDDFKCPLPLSNGKAEQSPILKCGDKVTASTEVGVSGADFAGHSSNGNDRGLRNSSSNSKVSTRKTTLLSLRASQTSIKGPLNRNQRDNKRLRPGPYKRKILINEDKATKKRAQDALRELNLSQKVKNANKITSGIPVRPDDVRERGKYT